MTYTVLKATSTTQLNKTIYRQIHASVYMLYFEFVSNTALHCIFTINNEHIYYTFPTLRQSSFKTCYILEGFMPKNLFTEFYRILAMSTKMSKFCTNMDLLILHRTIALVDCMHLPRPNTSNIIYESNDKILEFMYPDGDLNHYHIKIGIHRTHNHGTQYHCLATTTCYQLIHTGT